jgi:hypothetical protein
MKSTFQKTVLLFLVIISSLSYSQSIHFSSPTNGQIITNENYGSTETQVYVSLLYGYTTSGTGWCCAFVKLFTDQGNYNSQNPNVIPTYFYRQPGTYNWRIELWEYNVIGESFKRAEQTITFYVKHTLHIQNNFSEGTINVDGNNSSSGTSVYKFTGANLTVGAIDQSYADYNRIWNTGSTNPSNWLRKSRTGSQLQISGATARNYNYSVVSNDNGATITADMKKVCNVTFQTGGVGIGNNNGTISIVNGPSGTSPVTGTVVENNNITANFPNDFWCNNIHYLRNGAASVTLTPNSHTVSTKQYTGYPEWPAGTPRNLVSSHVPGQRITLSWTAHPNQNVTKYEIWKKELPGLTPVKVTEVTGTSWTDNYVYNPSGNIIYYDVRAYYSAEGTTSPESWISTLAGYSWKSAVLESEKISDYSLSNYPNPFNPTTRIEYQLSQAGFVTLKVYNALGKEIAILVNERMEEGKYQVEFNGSDQPSGIYFCQYTVNDYVQTMKMLMVK